MIADTLQKSADYVFLYKPQLYYVIFLPRRALRAQTGDGGCLTQGHFQLPFFHLIPNLIEHIPKHNAFTTSPR